MDLAHSRVLHLLCSVPRPTHNHSPQRQTDSGSIFQGNYAFALALFQESYSQAAVDVANHQSEGYAAKTANN